MSEAAAELPTNLISVERWSIDHSAWLRGVVRQYEQPLIAFAARIVGDPELARDVVQDTFVRLGESGPWQFASGDPAKWLFKVCRNRAVDFCRRTKRLSFVDQAELESEPAPDESPAEAVARRDDASALLRLVAGLSPRQQEVDSTALSKRLELPRNRRGPRHLRIQCRRHPARRLESPARTPRPIPTLISP